MTLKAVDVLIVGGGFGGLSAALTVLRQRQSVLLYDSGSYRDRDSGLMHTLSTWDNGTSDAYRAAARVELEQYDNFELRNAEVTLIEARKGEHGFSCTDELKVKTNCLKVILASGVDDIFPPIPGFADCWGKSILHCLFCDGYKSSPVATAGVLAIGLISETRFALHMTHMAASFAKAITIYTNGNVKLRDEIESTLSTSATPSVAITVDVRPISFLRAADDHSSITVQLVDGQAVTQSYIACAPNTRLRGPWDAQLGLKIDGTGLWHVNQPFFESAEAPGVYICGDAITNFKVAPNAVASGSTVGAAVAIKIQEEKWSLESVW